MRKSLGRCACNCSSLKRILVTLFCYVPPCDIFGVAQLIIKIYHIVLAAVPPLTFLHFYWKGGTGSI